MTTPASETPFSNPVFSDSQKEWLDGFLHAAASLAGTAPGDSAPCPYPAEAMAGYRAQTRWLAEGKRLSREEDIKRRRNPLLFRARLAELDARGEFPEGEENFLARFHGIFNVAPAEERPMSRFRIPGGILNSLQARALADLARACADGVLWLTTRSNVQVRNIQPGSLVDLLVRLEEVGLTARGSGADNIRNVVGNPTAGIDPAELLDVRPLCRAWHHHVLNAPDLHGLPRKFNVAFDGGNSVAALEDTNDIGLRACRVDGLDGIRLRLALGGITGHKDLARDAGVVLSPDEWLPATHAMLMVFLEHGNRGQRGKARLKYVLDEWGFERFLATVQERLPFPLRRVPLEACGFAAPMDRAAHLGAHRQKQEGLYWLGVHVPVGRLSADQFEGLASIARDQGDGDLRLTVWQNLILSGVPEARLNEARGRIAALGLSCEPDGILQGLVACTGSESCKHGQAATKRTALRIEERLRGRVPASSPVNVHLTGCPHSCAQHYVGDIGLLGTGLERDGIRHDAFHVLVGGGTGTRARIGRPLFPSVDAEEIPELVERMVERWLAARTTDEPFVAFVARHDDDSLRTLFSA